MDIGQEERITQEEHREEAASYAEAAIKDLARRTGAGQLLGGRNHPFYERYRTIGESIVSRYNAEEGIRYIGERIESPEKLAALMQGYRNPLFESMRFVYIKDDMVVDVETYSNHLPNYTVLPFKNRECAEHINGRMRALAADGYYLVHNHPSGDPKPSFIDQKLTREIARGTEGYLGHIITNHVRYALLDRDAEYQMHQLNVVAEDPFQGVSIEHPLLGEKIASPDALAKAGKALQVPEQSSVSALIYVSSANEIRKIQEISNEIFADPEFKSWLGKEMRSIGAVTAFCATADQDVYDRFADPLIRQRYLQDVVYLDADYPFYWSKKEAGVLMDKAYLYAGMTETDLEFIYQGGTNRELAYKFSENAGEVHLVGEEAPEWRNRRDEMKIQRMVNGKNQEITLTGEEIYQAYLLQEREFDKQDVRNAVQEMDEEDRFQLEYNLGKEADAILSDDALISCIATDMRSRMEKQDIEKETAFWQAVQWTKIEMAAHQEAQIGEIVERYQSELNMQDGYINQIAIIRERDGYHNHFFFDEDKGQGTAGTGAFATLADARQDVLAHCPDAREVDVQDEVIQIGDCECTKIAEWDWYDDHYLLGRATDQDDKDSDWHYAIVNDDPASIIEYDRRPSRAMVESDYTDMEAAREIDRQEAEFGADGWRAFGSGQECDIMDEYNDLIKQWMEQVNELSYKDQFKMVLAMEFPETAGEDKLQDELYERFMEEDSETGFFSGDFRTEAEREIKTYQESQQKELDGIDDILIF